jgi:cytochrome P450
MVDVLLDQMEDEASRFDISEKHINGLLWNSFIGGTGTTIDVVEWALSECIRNPKLMSKVQDELDTVVGKARRVEDADIPNLKFFQAVIKETFRLHLSTPILFPHVNQTACKLFGYDIPAGTTVLVCAGAIARDPSVWENPLEFKPERFLDGSPHANTDYQGHHFELVTFGSGRRGCPGTALASTMVHILTANLLHSFDWSLPNEMPPMDLDMSEAPGRLHRRAQPLKAILKARLPI